MALGVLDGGAVELEAGAHVQLGPALLVQVEQTGHVRAEVGRRPPPARPAPTHIASLLLENVRTHLGLKRA